MTKRKKYNGFATTFCNQMAKRTHQYAVRSMYDIYPFHPDYQESKRREKRKQEKASRTEPFYTPKETPTKMMKVKYGKDKNGREFDDYVWCIYKGKLMKILDHTTSMVECADEWHKMSSVEFYRGWELRKMGYNIPIQ